MPLNFLLIQVASLAFSSNFVRRNVGDREFGRFAKICTIIQKHIPPRSRFYNLDPYFLEKKDPSLDKRWEPFLWYGFQPELFEDFEHLELWRSTSTRFGKERQKLEANDPANLDFIPEKITVQLLVECKQIISKHRDLYQQGKPQIDDFRFDIFKRKFGSFLAKARKDKLVAQPDPRPLAKSDEFCEAYSPLDLTAFLWRMRINLGVQMPNLLCTPIVSGVPFKVVYKGGFLQEACVTGRREKTVDITDLIRSLSSVPNLISERAETTVFGTLFLNKRDFQLLNLARINLGLTAWMDTRAAIMNTLLTSEEPNKTLGLKLKCFFDNCIIASDKETMRLDALSKVLEYLADKGFPTFPRTCVSSGSWMNILPSIYRTSGDIPFENSGFIISIDELRDRNLASLKDCFYKVIPNIEKTRLNRINFNVLDNGTITAFAEVQPVKIDEKVINKFRVNSMSQLAKLDVRPGDTVEISSYRNMPAQIVKSEKNSSAKPIPFPSHCPKCKAAITQRVIDGEVTASCSTHLSCTDDRANEILHFSSICGLHIPSLTPAVINELLNKLLISEEEDLFSLSMHDYSLLEKIPRDNFERLLEEIKLAQNTTLERFIYSLNIPSVTYIIAEELAYAMGTVERLLNISKAHLSRLKYTDPKTINNILSFFSNIKNIQKIRKLRASGVTIAEPNKEILELCYKNLETYTRENYKKIVKKIQACNEHYTITDFEFDLLNKTAKQIEDLHPAWTEPRLAIQRKRNLVECRDPVNIKRTYSEQELELFCEKIKSSRIIVEPKINGIGCMLEYEKGKLKRAILRSDQNSGEDFTDYAEYIRNIPKTLSESFTGIIRGELYITNKDLKKLNDERQKSGLEVYADSLGLLANFTTPTGKKNNPLYSSLNFFGFHMIDKSICKVNLVSQIELHDYLKKIGFRYDFTETPFRIFTDSRMAVKYAADVEARRKEFSANIDGMVLKPNGFTKLPALPCAYKFKLETRLSHIKNIDFNLGTDGYIAAVAEIAPLQFSNGRVVTRVQLTNESLKKIYEGDTVSINYAGGIRPVLEAIKEDKRKLDAVPIKLPDACPACHKNLEQQESGQLQCRNIHCVGQVKTPLLRFAQAMNISKRVVDKLIQNNLIAKISDFYRLLPEDIHNATDWSEEETTNLFLEIEASKTASMEKFLFALNIGFGDEKSRQVASIVPDLKKLVHITIEDLCSKGINHNTAQQVIEYCKNNREEINSLASLTRVGASRETQIIDLPSVARFYHTRQVTIAQLIQSMHVAIVQNIRENCEAVNFLNMIKSKNETDKALLNKLIHSIRKSQRENERLKKFIEAAYTQYKNLTK
jgi:DNA ligase (NAD+)